MKKEIILYAFIILIFNSCKKDENNPIIPTDEDDRVSFEINYTNYSDNNYLIDAIYADESLNMFNMYYGSIIPTVYDKYFIKNVEVYISINTFFNPETDIRCNAYLHLPSRNSSHLYPDSLRNNSVVIDGEEENGYFKKLSEGSDYVFNPYVGHITFLFTPKNNEAIAVAFRIQNNDLSNDDDLVYGEFISELVNNSKMSIVLKLVKPINLYPTMTDAWKLKLKNIYKIEPPLGYVENLDLDIYMKSNSVEINKINGMRFIELFGFDKFDENDNNMPDGKFDDRPGINYNPSTSEILFPVLQPFGNNLPDQLNDSLKYQAIYDSVKSLLSADEGFVIKGKYKPR